jgi:hypothetical protein
MTLLNSAGACDAVCSVTGGGLMTSVNLLAEREAVPVLTPPSVRGGKIEGEASLLAFLSAL